MKIIALSFFLFLTGSAFSQDKPAYMIYTGEGKKSDYGEMVRKASKADIVLFGELHDDAIAHWMELEITKSLFEEKGNNLVMGAEMFESDDQLVLNEYLRGAYDASKFEAEVKLWNNYKTDYKPLVEFARKNKLPFVATNVPRRYASIVSRKGFEGLEELDPEARKYFPQLPILYDPDLNCYKGMLRMGPMGGDSTHVNLNFPKAQAIKDATMAHFILENMKKGNLMIHFNGSYHSSNFEGIVWYLKQSDPGLQIVTIETIRETDIEKKNNENRNIASFVIAIPESMTRTY